jgi:putative DNA primase/helicase
VQESGKPRGFNLGDIIPLAGLLDDIDDCLLIVIDPISAYLAGTDSHKNSDIRALLTPLSQMAASRGVAIIAVSHLNKSQAGNALGRVTGSLAFVAAARAAYIVARDQDDQSKRLLLPIKNNLGNDRTGLSYRIAEENGIPYILWDREPVTISADDALAPVAANDTQRAAKASAGEFLLQVLDTTPVKVTEIKTQAKAAGLSWITVRRAKDSLGVKSKKQVGVNGEWLWFMPLTTKMLTRADTQLSTFDHVEHLCTGNDPKGAQHPLDAQGAHDSHLGTVSTFVQDCTADQYKAIRE